MYVEIALLNTNEVVYFCPAFSCDSWYNVKTVIMNLEASSIHI
jgi:hypothetical protein